MKTISMVRTVSIVSTAAIPRVWRGSIGEYHLKSEKLGFNMARGPQARGLYWTPISKTEDGIPRYVRARLAALTLLFIQLEAKSFNHTLLAKFDKFKSEVNKIKSLILLSTTVILFNRSDYQNWLFKWFHIILATQQYLDLMIFL